MSTHRRLVNAQHDEPEVPIVQSEEGFSDLLPPQVAPLFVFLTSQKLNVAKFYHEEQLALVMYSCLPQEETKMFFDELRNPSLFMKKLAIKEVLCRKTR